MAIQHFGKHTLAAYLLVSPTPKRTDPNFASVLQIQARCGPGQGVRGRACDHAHHPRREELQGGAAAVWRARAGLWFRCAHIFIELCRIAEMGMDDAYVAMTAEFDDLAAFQCVCSLPT